MLSLLLSWAIKGLIAITGVGISLELGSQIKKLSTQIKSRESLIYYRIVHFIYVGIGYITCASIYVLFKGSSTRAALSEIVDIGKSLWCEVASCPNLELEAWSKVENTPDDYRAYLKDFPLGAHADETKRRIADLEAAETAAAGDKGAWETARRIDTTDGYREYLTNPLGAHADEAKRRIGDLEAAEAAAARDEESWRAARRILFPIAMTMKTYQGVCPAKRQAAKT